ncbi:MAG: hypothetical protein GX483_08965 [Actinomycetaceae bacterium]|nr:hypothetical protein [Actinomycetaceae bacterium]
MIVTQLSKSMYKTFEIKDENGNPLTIAVMSVNYNDRTVGITLDIVNKEQANANKQELEKEIKLFMLQLNEKLNEIGMINIIS